MWRDCRCIQYLTSAPNFHQNRNRYKEARPPDSTYGRPSDSLLYRENNNRRQQNAGTPCQERVNLAERCSL